MESIGLYHIFDRSLTFDIWQMNLEICSLLQRHRFTKLCNHEENLSEEQRTMAIMLWARAKARWLSGAKVETSSWVARKQKIGTCPHAIKTITALPSGMILAIFRKWNREHQPVCSTASRQISMQDISMLILQATCGWNTRLGGIMAEIRVNDGSSGLSSTLQWRKMLGRWRSTRVCIGESWYRLAWHQKHNRNY